MSKLSRLGKLLSTISKNFKFKFESSSKYWSVEKIYPVTEKEFIEEFFKDRKPPIFPIKAKDLMEQYKIPEGKQLGWNMKKIEQKWFSRFCWGLCIVFFYCQIRWKDNLQFQNQPFSSFPLIPIPAFA